MENTLIAERMLLDTISAAEKVPNAAEKEGACDDFVTITLTKSEWANVLTGLDFAIDDRLEMSAAAYDEEDAANCAESADELTRLRDVISGHAGR